MDTFVIRELSADVTPEDIRRVRELIWIIARDAGADPACENDFRLYVGAALRDVVRQAGEDDCASVTVSFESSPAELGIVVRDANAVEAKDTQPLADMGIQITSLLTRRAVVGDSASGRGEIRMSFPLEHVLVPVRAT
jgi:hypothetical protein